MSSVMLNEVRIPDNSIYLNEMKKDLFKNENPQEIYRTLAHINSGSQGQIYKVERKSDEAIYALKKVKISNEQEWEDIQNEVSLMMLCKSDDNILRCFDAYKWKG